MTVLEISKRLQESKNVCPAKWPKYNRKWIELLVTAEMMGCQPS
jgi:hypothetical protein